MIERNLDSRVSVDNVTLTLTKQNFDIAFRFTYYGPNETLISMINDLTGEDNYETYFKFAVWFLGRK